MGKDFSQYQTNKYKTYGGANGSKLCLEINDENYMLKFPAKARINVNISYSNSVISEYIGCNIYNIVGIDAQQTMLGEYKNKIVVACKDFETEGYVFKDFASLKNTIIDSVRGGYGTELTEIIETIEEQKLLNSNKLKDFFWDMFIVDSYIGNFDRHNGNWGVLINEKNKDAKLAPIFDCGSCLFAEMDKDKQFNVTRDLNELKYRVYVIPKSAIVNKEKKINYFDFISSLQNEDCNKALKRIVPLINVSAINKMIDEIEYIEPIQKEFYKTMLQERKSKILDFSLDKLLRKEYDEKISCKNQTNLKEVDIGE